MTTISRRSIIGVAGAGLVVSACSKTENNRSSKIPKNDFDFTTFDPIWNYGSEPWEPVPNGWNKNFDPSHLCVVHIELTAELLIKAQRVHRTANKSPANDWASNTANAVQIINALNLGQTLPNTDKVYAGLKGLAFGRAHHVVFYVKNSNAVFDPEYPIWFGKKLRNPFNGSKKADHNESFFNSKPQSLSNIVGGSQSVAYVENHFKAGNGNAHKPIPNSKDLMYSLNLNIVVPTAEDSAYTIPLVIDPDTGNMGGGGPP